VAVGQLAHGNTSEFRGGGEVQSRYTSNVLPANTQDTQAYEDERVDEHF
jgi:hypothetical protein